MLQALSDREADVPSDTMLRQINKNIGNHTEDKETISLKFQSSVKQRQ